MVALNKLLGAKPEYTTDKKKLSWTPIIEHLLFPHAWVRTASCRLVNVLFSAVPVAAPLESSVSTSTSTSTPTPTSTNSSGSGKGKAKETEVHGVEDPFTLEGMEEVAKKLCLQLRSVHLDATLGLLVVKNLFYVGKCFALKPLPVVGSSSSSDEATREDEDEEAESEGEGEGPAEGENEKERHPLPWLFSKLSYQARSAHITRRNKSSSHVSFNSLIFPCSKLTKPTFSLLYYRKTGITNRSPSSAGSQR